MNNIPQLPPILDFNPDTDKGMLFDTRDGQSYPVVKIGNQIWLAENFRYLPSIKDKGDLYDTSYVYDNNNDYLDKGYGRLYDFNTANHIAPEGWRLPNDKDFKELIDFIIKDNNLTVGEVGSYLKSVNGWELCDGIVNNDKYGFNAKPAGYSSNKRFYNEDESTYFWNGTMKGNRGYANRLCLHSHKEGFYSYDNGKYCAYSVRLIKDT